MTVQRLAPQPMRELPDIADTGLADGACLDWVGMSNIELPIHLQGPEGAIEALARIQAYVNIHDVKTKGIHMSRLYLALTESLSERCLTPALLHTLLQQFLTSHESISDRAFIEIAFELPLSREALVSGHRGVKVYPVRLRLQGTQHTQSLECAVTVAYSSTCPCSAALARQLIQDDFAAQFGAQGTLDAAAVHAWLGSAQGVAATPHSQRSYAQLTLSLACDLETWPLVALIDRVEQALSTPVQAAVKRADEQAFARLNGENPMFCEDAARRIKKSLDADPNILDFWARVNHLESLHPHDAVAIVTKGLQGGLQAVPGPAFSAGG